MAKMFEFYIAKFEVEGLEGPLYVEQVVPEGMHPQDADASMTAAATHKAAVRLLGERPSLRRDGIEKVTAWYEDAARIAERLELIGVERVATKGMAV